MFDLDDLDKAWNEYFELNETTPPEDYEKAVFDTTVCPECLEPTRQEELDMFDGMCEYCNELQP